MNKENKETNYEELLTPQFVKMANSFQKNLDHPENYSPKKITSLYLKKIAPMNEISGVLDGTLEMLDVDSFILDTEKWVKMIQRNQYPNIMQEN